MSDRNTSAKKTSSRKWKVIVIVAVGIVVLLFLASTTFKTPEIKGVVLDAETGQPIADARIYAKWEREMRGFGGESSGGIEKERHLKTKGDGSFLIPARTMFNFIPSPIGIKGFFYMIIYAHGYKLKNFVFHDEESFGHPKSYEEFKKLGENKILTFKLEEIKDPEIYIKNFHDLPTDLKSKEDMNYQLVECQIFVDRFPTHKKVPGYRLGIGTIYEQMKDKEKAKLQYERIIKDFPESSGAKEAQIRLEKLRRMR